jgi:hypothetical protein
MITLILIALFVLIGAVASGYAFQLNCETFISADDGNGNYEDWRLATQTEVTRDDGETFLKCLYRTYESYHAPVLDTDTMRGSN